jgi:cytidyltransferase-like protein
MPQDRRGTALIVGKFAPPHKGHQYLIETALKDPSVDEWIVLVYSNPDFLPHFPSQRRAEWLRQLYPQLKVFVPLNPPPNSASDFIQREFVKDWLKDHNLSPDWVYTSEDYGEGFARHIGAKHVMVDKERKKFDFSGTVVRELLGHLEQTRRTSSNPYRAVLYDPTLLEKLKEATDPFIYQQLLHWLEPVKRVVFMGAESTGKSTLTKAVAEALNLPHVAEYGREHYEYKSGVLELTDYLHIARHHRELEDRIHLRMLGSGLSGYVFIDTNALTTLFFSYYYNQGGLPELHKLAGECANRYHHIFVCADDIPFEQDGWRDNAVWRGRMQGLVLHDLDSRGIHYTVVHGSVQQRVEQVKRVLGGEWLGSTYSTKHLGPRPT